MATRSIDLLSATTVRALPGLGNGLGWVEKKKTAELPAGLDGFHQVHRDSGDGSIGLLCRAWACSCQPTPWGALAGLSPYKLGGPRPTRWPAILPLCCSLVRPTATSAGPLISTPRRLLKLSPHGNNLLLHLSTFGHEASSICGPSYMWLLLYVFVQTNWSHLKQGYMLLILGRWLRSIPRASPLAYQSLLSIPKNCRYTKSVAKKNAPPTYLSHLVYLCFLGNYLSFSLLYSNIGNENALW